MNAAYSKAREQLRAEQGALESARTQARRLQEALEAAHHDITALKEQVTSINIPTLTTVIDAMVLDHWYQDSQLLTMTSLPSKSRYTLTILASLHAVPRTVVLLVDCYPLVL